ncbi:MAG: phosphate ABC transporter permease subunit PstC [Candidatus Hydrogenedentes bacterium]|nr:phosphate ABC transporter permease subunit PstC [Candidatus Hydrogenedentota bacterium]
MQRAWRERCVFALLWLSASISIILVVLIFLFLIREGAPFLKQPGLQALTARQWQPVSFQGAQYGLLPLVTGSLLVTVLATLIAVPAGVAGAVYLAEVAAPREREVLKPVIELLAAVPSVVLGFFGLVVVAPLVKEIFGLQTGLNALSGSLLLALMAVPTIMSISEDAIRNVPTAYKAAAMALGANRLQVVVTVIVPAAKSGILAAVMLGMGRVIGETMAVLMVTGNAPIITANPTESVRTMTATIAAEMGEVTFGDTHYQALFVVGVVLLLATFALNLIVVKALRQGERQ